MLPHSAIFLLDFGDVPTIWCFCFSFCRNAIY